ncbi:hypothetical protein [Streptomyces sp. AB3(2024)]|uniref:hypothetical protein n=1 Tax=Streptomyces sp. AB3(2024) TaxID=3317321 RepID=UPI0035A3A739
MQIAQELGAPRPALRRRLRRLVRLGVVPRGAPVARVGLVRLRVGHRPPPTAGPVVLLRRREAVPPLPPSPGRRV